MRNISLDKLKKYHGLTITDVEKVLVMISQMEYDEVIVTPSGKIIRSDDSQFEVVIDREVISGVAENVSKHS